MLLAAVPQFGAGCDSKGTGAEQGPTTIYTEDPGNAGHLENAAQSNGPSEDEDVKEEEASTDVEQPVVILPPGGAGAASNLQAEVECDPEVLRKAIAKLSWTVAAGSGRAQRVDVTILGFEQGAFESSDSLACDQTSLVWDSLHGQAIHRWRVLTLQPEGWMPSETASFLGLTCVADFVDP